MNYSARIDRVIDFIGQHLDEELTLEQLAEVACLSSYHFHRLFTVYTGTSLQAYIKWLRLKRAAHQLIVHKEVVIIQIALDAGYESHESFSRAFKQACGQSPSAFRRHANWQAWEQSPYSLPIRGEKIVNIEIKELPAKRLAVIEHRGDPARLSVTLDKLLSWAKAQSIDVMPKPGEAFGYAYEDPRYVDPEAFRFDMALSVPQNFVLDDQVIERELPAGRYAVFTYKGPRKLIGDDISQFCRNWLPDSGEELADLPTLFCYHTFDYEVAESEQVTEVRVLLK